MEAVEAVESVEAIGAGPIVVTLSPAKLPLNVESPISPAAMDTKDPVSFQ